MSELQDFDLEPSSEDQREKPPMWPYIVGAVVLVLAVGAFFFFRSKDEVVELPAPSEPAPAVETADDGGVTEPPEVILPPLADSDVWLREVVSQLSSHPQLAEWLVTDELVRRFVAAVDNLAEGVSPRTHLTIMRPDEEFRAAQKGSRQYISPTSYDRYTRIVAVVDSVDVRGTADLYNSVRPLLDEAYRDLGYPDRNFQDTLTAAFNEVLSTPIPVGDVEVLPQVQSYHFADPELESLSPVQKHFVRMGPDNTRRVQRKLRELALAIGIPAGDLASAS